MIPLMDAVMNGSVYDVRNTLALVTTCDVDKTALMYAIERGDNDIITALVYAGVNVNSRWEGWTALLFAADIGNVCACRVLIDAGAEVDAQSGDDWSALMFAAANGHDECVRVLVDAGASIDVTECGWTSLMHASLNGHARVACILLEAGANVNAHDISGYTSLMEACFAGQEACVRVLLKAGASVDVRNKCGKNALNYAYGRVRCTAILMAKTYWAKLRFMYLRIRPAIFYWMKEAVEHVFHPSCPRARYAVAREAGNAVGIQQARDDVAADVKLRLLKNWLGGNEKYENILKKCLGGKEQYDKFNDECRKRTLEQLDGV